MVALIPSPSVDDLGLIVPKGIEANLAYRREILRIARGDLGYRSLLWSLCRSDILFYVNTFVWTFNPKLKGEKVIPFVTYPFQDVVFRELVEAVADHDLVIEKSRDMGASWMCLTVFEWFWHFYDYQTFLMVSRKEDLVDKSGDPKALFYKVDFIHKHLPSWLVPEINRTNLHLNNEDNGSTIDGESTTGDVGRGDRRTAVLCDEFAMVQDGYKVNRALRDVTDCRIFNSTPAGAAGAFYDHVNNPHMKKIRLHWSEHPVKADGLYRDLSGKVRSPYYDLQCLRANNPVEIAMELDIDSVGGVSGIIKFSIGASEYKQPDGSYEFARHGGSFDIADLPDAAKVELRDAIVAIKGAIDTKIAERMSESA